MINFEFSNVTEIVFGKDTEKQVGEKIRKYSGCSKVLLVYGSDRIKKDGLFHKVEESLKNQQIQCYELGGVLPNPRLGLVRKGIELCRKEDVTFILAIGGGSAIDTAKAIGVGVFYEGDVWDFYLGKDIPKKTLPTAAICTIPAAGSEASLSSVITNEDGWLKKSINLELIRPVFSIINPELTYTLPPYQIGCGVVDMMTHIMERYFTNTTDVDLTDRLCEAALRSIIANGVKTLLEPDNYAYRAEIVWAGTLAHNGLLNTGRVQDWASHRIALELSGKYDIAHGASLAIVYPNWMKYVYMHDLDRFVQFAVRVWDVDLAFGKKEEIVLECIACMQEFFKKLGMPLTFQEGNMPTDAFEEMANKATCGDTMPVGNFVRIDKRAMMDIYGLCAN